MPGIVEMTIFKSLILVGGRFKRVWPYVELWLIHVVIRQKLTQPCKAIILQLNSKY